MEIVLFHTRTRPDLDKEAYQRAFADMLRLVSEVPGFLGIDGYLGEDGSELAVARFDSLEAVALWREHPEHVRTRQRGREEFFVEYDLTVATVSRQYSWFLPGQPGATDAKDAKDAKDASPATIA